MNVELGLGFGLSKSDSNWSFISPDSIQGQYFDDNDLFFVLQFFWDFLKFNISEI